MENLTQYITPAVAVLILAILFVGYTWLVYKKFGVLSSISASSYHLEKPWWFAAWLGGMAFFTFFLQLGFMGHLMAIGFCGAGMSIEHKKGPGAEDEIHTWATIGAVLSGFLGIWAVHGIVWPLGAAAIGAGLIYLIRKAQDDHIWYIECWWMLVMAGGILSGLI